jgi:hypothetical protein
MDPLGIETDLPLSGIYHPVGFRLHIATNSRDVLEAAEESWGHQRQEHDCQPIQFRVVVQPEGELCGIASHRAHGDLYSVVCDPWNHAALDTRALTGSMFVSQRTAAEHVWLRWFFVESLAYSLLAQRYVVPVHSACVARNGLGIMLCGRSGAGKSTLAYACARAGWTYVTDDCVFLLPDSSRIAIGRCRQIRFRPDAPGLFPELAGFMVRARPNGKVSIEVPMGTFPELRTAERVPVGVLVFLDRAPGSTSRLQTLDREEAVERLMADMPSYGTEVNAMHDRMVWRLAEIPVFRMQYESLNDAIELLGQLIP